MGDNRSLEKALYGLAERGWANRRIALGPEFLLRPESLPGAASGQHLEGVVAHLYGHARRWAPGFDVPFSVPRVGLSVLTRSAGQYRVDSDGYLFIDVDSVFADRRDAILTVLAHEACHHILDLSAIRGTDDEETERLTDLAAFVCGFGQILLNGHSLALRTRSQWSRVHIGYLSSQQYAFAHHWVLRVQGLPIPQDLGAMGVDATAAAQRRGLWSRIRRWLWPGRRAALRSAGASPASKEVLRTELLDVAAQRRKTALARVGGDVPRLDRLMAYERRRDPAADELAILDAVIESLERDRR